MRPIELTRLRRLLKRFHNEYCRIDPALDQHVLQLYDVVEQMVQHPPAEK